MNTKTRFDVVAMGNAIVDMLLRTDDAFFEKYGLIKGVMTLIDGELAQKLYEEMPHGVECSGGSAANTAVGVASLGGKPVFIGKVADDALGKIFKKDITEAGVCYETSPLPASENQPTGRSFVFVGDDAQRTMHTYLGACSFLSRDDIDESVIAASKIVYIEGYLWDREEACKALIKAAELARKHRRTVALSLSDPHCVKRHRDGFLSLIKSGVGLIFCNEEEIKEMVRENDLTVALEKSRSLCDVVVVTLGAKGAVAVVGNQTFAVEAKSTAGVVDTTGAGDLFAAGFLTGYARGLPVAACLETGALAAAEIISHYGARPNVALKDLMEKEKFLKESKKENA